MSSPLNISETLSTSSRPSTTDSLAGSSQVSSEAGKIKSEGGEKPHFQEIMSNQGKAGRATGHEGSEGKEAATKRRDGAALQTPPEGENPTPSDANPMPVDPQTPAETGHMSPLFTESGSPLVEHSGPRLSLLLTTAADGNQALPPGQSLPLLNQTLPLWQDGVSQLGVMQPGMATDAAMLQTTPLAQGIYNLTQLVQGELQPAQGITQRPFTETQGASKLNLLAGQGIPFVTTENVTTENVTTANAKEGFSPLHLNAETINTLQRVSEIAQPSQGASGKSLTELVMALQLGGAGGTGQTAQSGAEFGQLTEASLAEGMKEKLTSMGQDSQWSQTLQALQQAQSGPKPMTMQTALPINFQQPEWSGALADHVMRLASQRIQSAEIHLDPPELGPLQVRIAVNSEQASVSFVSHSATVRDMLDQQSYRLRELFAEGGMDLVDVDVSDRGTANEEQSGESALGGLAGLADTGTEDLPGDNTANSVIQLVNLVDYYV